VEVRRHRLDRLLVGAGRLHVVDQRTVADADAAEEPPPVFGGQERMMDGGLLRRVHPYVEDAGGDRRRLRRTEQVADRTEDVATDAGDPQGGVAEFLELRREGRGLTGVAVAQRAA